MKRCLVLHSIGLGLVLVFSAALQISEAFRDSLVIKSRARGSKESTADLSLFFQSGVSFEGDSVSPTRLCERRKDISSEERGSDKVNSIIAVVGVHRGQ